MKTGNNEPITLFISSSDEPKSLLSRLSSQELTALGEWSKSQPRAESGAIDLMAWPGWTHKIFAESDLSDLKNITPEAAEAVLANCKTKVLFKL